MKNILFENILYSFILNETNLAIIETKLWMSEINVNVSWKALVKILRILFYNIITNFCLGIDKFTVLFAIGEIILVLLIRCI
jgi:hypothetical protein